MIDTYNQTADHPLSYAVGYELSCKNHYYLIMNMLQMREKERSPRTSGIKNSSRKTDLSPPAVCLLRAFHGFFKRKNFYASQ